MAIAYTGRHAYADLPYRFEPSLLALARDSDILVVAVAGGSPRGAWSTRGSWKRSGLRASSSTSPAAAWSTRRRLIDALRQGRLAGAGLDVFENEPDVPEALLAMDQVVLQPHQASATVETREAMGRLVLDNLAAHFAGRPLLTPVA